jgi:cytochrome c-type biogenesis protein CcmH
MRAHWASLLLLLLGAGNAWGVDIEPPIEDPVIREQYEALIREVRCLVCQNQTIADSSAPLAADLRREIREMMVAGASAEQVTVFLTERYGDFVMYRPPVQPTTWLLWAAPTLLVGLGLLVFVRVLRQRSRQPYEPVEHEGDA